jgi:hypothetical protein
VPIDTGAPRCASASAKAQDLRFYCGGSDRLPHIGIYVEVYSCLIIDQSRTIRAALGNLHYLGDKWYIYYTAGTADNLDGQRSHVLAGMDTHLAPSLWPHHQFYSFIYREENWITNHEV